MNGCANCMASDMVWVLVIMITVHVENKPRLHIQYHEFEDQFVCREAANTVRKTVKEKHVKNIYAQCFEKKKTSVAREKRMLR